MLQLLSIWYAPVGWLVHDILATQLGYRLEDQFCNNLKQIKLTLQKSHQQSAVSSPLKTAGQPILCQ